MLPTPIPGTRLHEIADGAGFDFQPNQLSQGTRPMIRYVFDGSIALACLTLLGLALCSPL